MVQKNRRPSSLRRCDCAGAFEKSFCARRSSRFGEQRLDSGAHILLFDQYLASHAREAEMMKSLPLAPKAMMAITGPVVGVVSGVAIGIPAVIAGKMLKRAPAAGR